MIARILGDIAVGLYIASLIVLAAACLRHQEEGP